VTVEVVAVFGIFSAMSRRGIRKMGLGEPIKPISPENGMHFAAHEACSSIEMGIENPAFDRESDS
jgi:hypothetical protein